MTEEQENAARQAAADTYPGDDILINDDAPVIEEDGGVWVQAWLWVKS